MSPKPDTNEPRLIRRPMRFERNFTQLPNAWMRDERISYRARGLLAMLMTHELGRTITIKSIVDNSPTEGRDAIRASVAELEHAGYLERQRIRARSGILLGSTWELFDPFDSGAVQLPRPVHKPMSAEPTSAEPTSAEPTRAATDEPTPIEDQLRTSKKSSRSNHRTHDGEAVDSWPYVEHVAYASNRICRELPDPVNPKYCGMGHILVGHALNPEPLEYIARLDSWMQRQAVAS